MRCYEPVFLYILAKKDVLARKRELQAARAELEHSRKRIGEIDRILSQMYEDNITGKISDERFSRMSQTYEAEQRDLEKTVAECEDRLRDADKATVDLRMLLQGLREFTELRELTPSIVNTLIKRIEVHNNDKFDGHCHVKVDIYFTAAGMIDLPTEQELLRLMSEMQTEQQPLRLYA